MMSWRRVLAVGGWAAASSPLAGQTTVARSPLPLPADTTVSPIGRWPLRVNLAGTTLVTVVLAPVAPDAPPIHFESQLVRSVHTFWPLRGPTGEAIEPGIYRLSVVTQDSASGEEATRVRVLAVDRIAADTQAHPPALDRAMFLPESAFVVTRRPGFLLIAGIGLAALATTWTFQEDEVVSPITVVVPGALAIGGLIGFLKGRGAWRPHPANRAHNRQLIADDLSTRGAIAGANARAVAAATWRIRVIDQP